MNDGGVALLERGRDLRVISSAISQLSDGMSSILVIEGPAGIGKTALAAAMVVAAVAAGLRVIRGGAKEIDRHRPFASFAADSVSASSVFDAITAGRSTVVVVDDLQWADRASLGVLERLIAASSGQPLAILLTLRPEPRPPALERVLAAARSRGAEELYPAPLSLDASAELAERTAGLPVGERLRAALAELGGNPLAIEQVVRGMLADGALAPDRSGALEQSTADPLPTPRAAIRQTVRGLEPKTFTLLGLAAVLGSSFPPAALGLMTNRPEAAVRDGLAEATTAGMLAPVDGQVAFRHDLIHEAFYDDLPIAVRRALHADAASVLEAVDAPPSVVAEHTIRAATDGGVAVIRLRRAMAAAVGVGAPAVARDLIAAAYASGTVDDARYRELAAELPADDA